MADKYLIDANVFFQAKNLWYKFNFALPFWSWIQDGHSGDRFFSIQKVKSEILQGNSSCPCKKWMQTSVPAQFFLDDEKDSKVRKRYAEVMTWAANAHAQKVFTNTALAEFAGRTYADAWLLATALEHGYVIVSHEKPKQSSGQPVGSIKIPTAASALGVKTISLFQLLDRHAGPAFSYQP